MLMPIDNNMVNRIKGLEWKPQKILDSNIHRVLHTNVFWKIYESTYVVSVEQAILDALKVM